MLCYDGIAMIYFDKEKPSPSRVIVMTAEMQDAECQERSEDICDGHSGPEETEPERELMMFVEV